MPRPRPLSRPGGEFLVAVAGVPPADPVEYGRDGELVVGIDGFVPGDAVAFRPSASVAPGDRTPVVRSVRVDPAFQHRSVGRSLMSELEVRADDRGFERVVLDAGEGMAAARLPYESLGYERVGRESVAGFELVYYGKDR